MSLYREYASSLERDTDILLKKFDVDVLKLESALEFDEAYSNIFTEAENSSNDAKEARKTSKWKQTLISILDRIKDLIHDFFDSFSKFFNDNHVDMEKFKNSRLGQEQMQYDYEQISTDIKRAQAENSRLIRGISHVTKKDALSVKEKIDNIADFVNNKVMTKKTGMTILKLTGLAIGSREVMKGLDADTGRIKNTIKEAKNNKDNDGKLDKKGKEKIYDILISNVHTLAALSAKVFAAMGGDMSRGMGKLDIK